MVLYHALPLLHTMILRVGCDLGDNKALHIYLVGELQHTILSLPENARLDSFVLEGLIPSRFRNRGWVHSPVINALRAPLHTLACRLSALPTAECEFPSSPSDPLAEFSPTVSRIDTRQRNRSASRVFSLSLTSSRCCGSRQFVILNPPCLHTPTSTLSFRYLTRDKILAS